MKQEANFRITILVTKAIIGKLCAITKMLIPHRAVMCVRSRMARIHSRIKTLTRPEL